MANQKRISELPIINALSGSSVSVIPVVVGGTTNQISADRFSEFVNAYNATTSSNTFIGNQTITGDLDVSGNTIIGGDVEVAGMITAQQYNVTYVSSSIQYQSGSTEFGDTADDTHTFTGTILLNGSAVGLGELNSQTASQDLINNGISAVTGAFATELGSIDSHILTQTIQTASQDLVNLRISSTTGSINTTTSSFDSVFLRISSTTGSINTTTSSFDSVFLGISSVTGAMNTQSSSQDSVNLGISSVTGSLIGIANGLMAFTASLDNTYATDAQLYDLYTFTSSQISVNTGLSNVTGAFATELGQLQTQNTSQGSVNSGISAVTGAFATELGGIQSNITSFNSVFSGVSAVTGAFATELGSIDSHILKQSTQTGSQDLVNLAISTFTGSIRNEVNGIEAYTASLKGQAIVSSSTQISNYYKFAETASANTFYGNQTISGSLNVTSSVNLSGSVVINGFTYPTFGFSDGQHGVEVPTLGVNNVFSMEIPKTVYEYVKNNSGATLLKGTPVHANDVVGFNSMVIAASASNAATMPATYILAQDLDDQEEGLGIAIGHIQGVNTTGLQAGQAVYVGANGGWTQTKPTGSNLIQNLGIVTKVGSNGGGVVLGAGRSNDVPNIQQGYFWVGNSGSVATPFPTSSFELSGRGVVSSSNQLPQIAELQTQNNSQTAINFGISVATASLRDEIGGIESYTSSLKSALTISGTDVTFAGKITAQEFTTVYTTSSVLYQSGSTKFGNSSDDTHEFTGSKFEVFNSDSSGTMYAVVKNNRARNAAVKTTTTNGSFIAGTSIGTDTFQYQIYDEVEGVNRVTINSQGGTTLQGAITASQSLRVGGVTQIGTSTVDTSLGSNTKLKVVGDGNVNGGASQGSLFIAAGTEGGDTGLPINMGTAGATMMLLASINTSTGTATNSATYIVRFYFDGDNAPTTSYLGGSSDFVTFGVTPSNTLAVSGSSSGNKSYAWFINKFGV